VTKGVDSDAPAIRLDGATKALGQRTVVDQVSFELPKGAILALLGANGAGKTTTIRLINAVLQPDSGTIEIGGLDARRFGNEIRSNAGVLTENAGLDDRLTALENLLFAAEVRELDRTTSRRRAHELLEQFGMSDHQDQKCRSFSTGQRRRVALARALLHDPELLLLDEPTSGLDPAGARSVMDLIVELVQNQARTVVLCTHFLAEAESVATWMAVMDRGRLQVFGQPAELAARLGTGIRVTIEVGNEHVDTAVAALTQAMPASVISRNACSVSLEVATADDVPFLVRRMVETGVEIFGVETSRHRLDQIYFAVQSGAAAAPRVPVVSAPRSALTQVATS
jgi:ABC-2 type transport system ATP-binding protein